MIAEYRALFRSLLEKDLVILRRYWLNTVGGMLVTYVMFAVVFFGGQAAAPDVMGDRLPAVIVGFFVWYLAYGTFTGPAQGIMQESQWGTLEQLYMTPLGFSTLFVTDIILGILRSLVLGLVLLVVMMVSTGRYLIVDLVTVVPLTVVTISTTIGLGLVFGGIVLIYKRIESVFGLIQVLLLAILALPSDVPLVELLPLKVGFRLLTRSMENGIRIWEFPVTELALSVAVAVGYLAVGYFTLRFSLRTARSRGVMGDY